MRKIFIHSGKSVVVIIAITILFSCGTGDNKTDKTTENTVVSEQSIMIFAAASLTDVLTEIIDSFKVKYKVKVETNVGSSGTLARQIEQGGTPDVYISASKEWANYIDNLGGILSGFKTAIAQNELVLITPIISELEVAVIDSSLNFLSLLGSGRLSIGDPAHVPAGRYAKQSLEYYGWYSKLENKTLPAKDVRSALMVVEMEEAPLGIVYRTDAQKSKKVKIMDVFSEKSHKPIVYIAGLCKEGKAAKDFYSYLNSDEIFAIWKKFGFKK